MTVPILRRTVPHADFGCQQDIFVREWYCERQRVCAADPGPGQRARRGSALAAYRGKGSHGLLYYGKEMTTVRDLKDEIDKRAYHKMLKQLCLSERDFE